MPGHTLKDVTTTSYLGITLQGNARFKLHISNIVGKANKTLGFLCKNLRIGATAIKAQAYN